MLAFERQIFNPIRERLLGVLLEQIELDRAGQNIQREVIKTCIRIYAELGLEKPIPRRVNGRFLWEGKMNLKTYDTHFEVRFLEETQRSANNYATQWNSTLNCPEYCREVFRFIAKEEENADYWLHFSS